MTCLFLINGLGLGNSTRCHAVIKKLAAAGCHIHILTSGNGLSYFQGRDEVESITEMESFYYSCKRGGISGWSMLGSLRSLYLRAKSKRQSLEGLVDELKPDIAVIDSEYAISPLRRRLIPIVAINNSEVVVTEYLKRRKFARGTRSHFWFVEYFDYLFHLRFADLILSPFPLRTPTRQPKFRRIGLIIRPEVKRMANRLWNQTSRPGRLRTVVFMLSGSIHSSRVNLAQHRLPFKVEVIGVAGESRGEVTYHGRQMDNLPWLAQADAFVINGGYSAVSEIFALRKPTFVIPVPGHAEQFVNANLIADMGLGSAATEADVVGRLLKVCQKEDWIAGSRSPVNFEIDGDSEAAEAILARATLKGKFSPPLCYSPRAHATTHEVRSS